MEKSHQGDFLQAAIGSNSTCNVKPENCKSRATKLKEYHCTINGSPSGFIHLEISLLSGRSEAVKSKIGTECTQIIREFLEDVTQVQVSVEIRDMDQNNYFTTNQL